MHTNKKYKLHGHLEFFFSEAGFVTPVFSSNDCLYVEVANDNIISQFIPLADEYLKLVKTNFKSVNFNVSEGDKCCYVFKYMEEFFYGNSNMLVEQFNQLLKRKIISYTVESSIKDFIEKFVPRDVKKTSVLIVDDHRLIRETWRYILDNSEDFEVIEDTGDGQRAISIAKDTKPQIVLMDINMSPLNGFDVTTGVRKVSPISKVIGFSCHSQPAYAKRMLRLGARGYVTKNSSRKELIDAMNEVQNGNVYICQEVKNILSEMMLEEKEDRLSYTLSDREKQIVIYIKVGLSLKEIAATLGISIKVVEVHRFNIIKKLKVRNTASLINYINAHGI